jgi:hypothetical protein
MTRPPVLLVNALDESTDPDGIVSRLIAPLARAGEVRVLVGTRRGYSPELRHLTDEIDLDSDRYFDRGDVIDYVVATLTQRIGSAYHNDRAAALEVAAGSGEGGGIAAVAGRRFLIARIHASAIADSRERIDVIEERLGVALLARRRPRLRTRPRVPMRRRTGS